MNRTSVWWDAFFLDMAEYVSRASKDPSTKVGAVVAKGKEVVGLGYNGFPRGVDDLEERLNNRELKYKFIVHAEVNALIMAGDKAKGGTLYVYPAFSIPNTCHDCAKTAIQFGIKEVVSYYPLNVDFERWLDSITIAKRMYDESGVKYRGVQYQS